MSTNSVKKYDVGSGFMNLPYKEYIHELPLITVSDLYKTVNLSLIYNSYNV